MLLLPDRSTWSSTSKILTFHNDGFWFLKSFNTDDEGQEGWHQSYYKAGSVFLDQLMVEMINYHPSEIFAELNRTSILKVFSIDLNPPSWAKSLTCDFPQEWNLPDPAFLKPYILLTAVHRSAGWWGEILFWHSHLSCESGNGETQKKSMHDCFINIKWT